MNQNVISRRPAARASQPSVIEESAYGKVFRRVVPFIVICYVVAYLDRINVGFAKLQMEIDLGFSQTVYGLGAGLFFIGYFFFEVPSNLIMLSGWRTRVDRANHDHVGPALGVLRLRKDASLVLHAPLPAWRSGGRLYPGVILYLTYWYPDRRRAELSQHSWRRFPSRASSANRFPAGSWTALIRLRT
jgi:hypothetical protein